MTNYEKKEIFIFLKPFLKKFKKELLIILFFSILCSLFQSIPAKITEELFNKGFLDKNYKLIVTYAVCFLILHILIAIFSIILNKKIILVGQNILSNIRKEIYKKTMEFPIEIYSKYDSDYINSRAKEINAISDLFSPNVFSIISNIFEFIFISYILITINNLLYLILLLPVPLMFIMIKIGMNKFIKKTEDVMEFNSKQSSFVNERIRGLEYIQTTGNENKELRKLNERETELVKKTVEQSILFRYLTEFISLFSVVTPILLYIIGGKLFVNDSITFGGVLTFSMYMNKVYSPFLNISVLLMSINPAFLSLYRIKKLFYDQSAANYKNNNHELIKIDNISKLSFHQVCFSYEKQPNILKNIDFSLNKGDIFKINGKNGTGKTTLIKILLGLLIPDSGKIYINDIDLEQLNLKSIRNKISVISQKIFLFNDSLRNNILYLDESNEQKYKQIIKKLEIDKIFKSRESDDNMIIGENGIKLSGGEIQKIAIARALMADADVIIFDEANSNIDNKTKLLLKNIVINELRDKIVIIIDHSNLFEDISNKNILLKKENQAK